MLQGIEGDPTVLIGIAAAVALVTFVLVTIWLRRRRGGGRPAIEAAEEEAGPTGRAERFRRGLARSRAALGSALSRTDGSTADAMAEIERALLESDVGVQSTERLLATLRGLAAGERTADGMRAALRREIEEILGDGGAPEIAARPPHVILVVGVNGVGKTTTIGKLACRHQAAGRSVLVIAGDTFRAAAIEQLTVWAERSGAQIVKQAQGADPSSVVFDGMSAAVARSFDVVLIDTAGRLHTKVNLMEELKKVRRVIERAVPGAPHEVLLVLDATTGQNAVSQARTFAEAVRVTGVVLTKLDGSARGGVVIAIRHELGLPVQYVGLGEGKEDLEPFDAAEFAGALLADGSS